MPASFLGLSAKRLALQKLARGETARSARTLCSQCGLSRTGTSIMLLQSQRRYEGRSAAIATAGPSPLHTGSRLADGHNCQGREYTSAAGTPEYEVSTLSPQQYHSIADATLETLQDGLEILIEDTDVPGSNEWDIESASGVMNVRLGSNGTYVINKQPPNNQIWLSSPTSGPLRFDYSLEHKTWFSTKSGRQTLTLGNVLRQELGVLVGQEVADAAVPEDLR